MTHVLRLFSPRTAMWLLTAGLAVGLAASVYRIPIQVSDSLEVFERVDATPSVSRLVWSSFTASSTNLRPMRDAQSAALVRLADATGADVTQVVRGYHALGAVLLVVLFAAALRCRTWTDVAAGAAAFTVLLGLHTTVGLFEEAFPINHFLLVALGAIMALLVARGRPSMVADVLLWGVFVAITLTVESGILLMPLALVASSTGQKGITSRTLTGLAVLALAYVSLRFGYLRMTGSSLGDRATGFGTVMLDGDALWSRFGDAPWLIYGYTVVSAALTVLWSQPIEGVWTAVRDWQMGDVPPYEVIAVTSSFVTTAVVAWHLLSKDEDGARGFARADGALFLTLLAGSATLSYAYAKTEVMSAAGVFYALVTYAAAQRLLTRSASWTRAATIAACVVGVSVGALWAVRATGLLYQLERAAFGARAEWVQDDGFSLDAHTTTRVASRLRRQALSRTHTNPLLLPSVAARIWGEP